MINTNDQYKDFFEVSVPGQCASRERQRARARTGVRIMRARVYAGKDVLDYLQMRDVPPKLLNFAMTFSRLLSRTTQLVVK